MSAHKTHSTCTHLCHMLYIWDSSNLAFPDLAEAQRSFQVGIFYDHQGDPTKEFLMQTATIQHIRGPEKLDSLCPRMSLGGSERVHEKRSANL